jgi:hypothetical protein
LHADGVWLDELISDPAATTESIADQEGCGEPEVLKRYTKKVVNVHIHINLKILKFDFDLEWWNAKARAEWKYHVLCTHAASGNPLPPVT